MFSLPTARCILFLIIWVVTGGRHHFWFLPNLTADVGFIDSFRPLYTHEYKGPRASSKKSSGEKAESKSSDNSKPQKSDSEDKSDSEKKEGEDEDEEEEDVKETETERRNSDTEDSERREDEGSQHSNGNDFEMITREELDQHTQDEDEEGEETKPLTVQT